MFPAGFGSLVSVSHKSYVSIGTIIGYTRSPSEGTSVQFVRNPNEIPSTSDVTVFKNIKKKVCYIKTIDEYVTVFDDFFQLFIPFVCPSSIPTTTPRARAHTRLGSVFETDRRIGIKFIPFVCPSDLK